MVGYVIFVGAVGALVGPVLGRVARRRAYRQPVAADVGAEKTVLAYVLAHPDAYGEVAILEPDAFVVGAHRDIWRALTEMRVAATRPELVDTAGRAGLDAWEIDKDAATVAVELAATLDDTAGARVGELAEADGVSHRKFFAAARRVLGAYEDRRMAGATEWETTGDDAAPLERRLAPVSSRRTWATVALTMVGSALAFALAGGGWYGASAVALVWGCVVVSLVDIDTMYVDFLTLGLTTVTAWALAGPGAVADDGGIRIAVTAAVTVCMVALLELVAFVYGRIRGRVGLGGGDTAVLLATLSVPVLITGDPLVAAAGMLASTLTALAWRFWAMARGQARWSDPFPFVPYLSAGWLVGWTFLVVVA